MNLRGLGEKLSIGYQSGLFLFKDFLVQICIGHAHTVFY
jgi:hypothetical protein